MTLVRNFLTVDEMAAYLGVSTKTVRRRLAGGDIRRAPFGGRAIRIPVSELGRLSGTEAVETSDENPQI